MSTCICHAPHLTRLKKKRRTYHTLHASALVRQITDNGEYDAFQPKLVGSQSGDDVQILLVPTIVVVLVGLIDGRFGRLFHDDFVLERVVSFFGALVERVDGICYLLVIDLKFSAFSRRRRIRVAIKIARRDGNKARISELFIAALLERES